MANIEYACAVGLNDILGRHDNEIDNLQTAFRGLSTRLTVLESKSNVEFGERYVPASAGPPKYVINLDSELARYIFDSARKPKGDQDLPLSIDDAIIACLNELENWRTGKRYNFYGTPR